MPDPVVIPHDPPLTSFPRKAARDAGGGFIITIPPSSAGYRYVDLSVSGPYHVTVWPVGAAQYGVRIRWPATPAERQPVVLRIYHHDVASAGHSNIEDAGEYVLLPPQ